MKPGFQTIVGVDFSGAKDASKKIWVAEAVQDGPTLALGRLNRLDSLTKSPDGPFAALRNHLTAMNQPIVGLDFPFSIPRELIDRPIWRDWLLSLANRYLDADAFRQACRAATGGREPRRQTDIEAAAPMSAFNLRLYRQTFRGLTDVLEPLVAEGVFRAYPMMDFEPGRPGLMEICPASVLQSWWGKRGNAGYKGQSATHLAKRQQILSTLVEKGLMLSSNVEAQAIENSGGDALDALLAVYATWRVALAPRRLQPRPGTQDAIEGRIYFER